VPRLIGQSVEEASELLQRRGFDFELVGDADTVTWQLPVANAFVASGTRVTLYLGAETPRDRGDIATVPDLSGMSYPRARAALEERGLFIRTVGVPKSDNSAIVSIQSVAAGLQTSYGTIVEVTLIDRASMDMQLET
jgi:beta-lactam-binding protein with PASTA domain